MENFIEKIDLNVNKETAAIESTLLDQRFVKQMFDSLDQDGSGEITVAEAENLLLRINKRLNKSYSVDNMRIIFDKVGASRDGKLTFSEFQTAVKLFF